MPARVDKLVFLNDRLARRRGFLESVLQSIQDGVLVVGADGSIVWANRTAESMLGIEDGHAAGRPAGRWLPDLDWEALSRGGDETWSRVSASEIEVFRPRRRILSFTAFPLGADEAGAAAEPGCVAILRDVTREREDAREALESERMQAVRTLAASLAHEIGNPLNALGIHLQLLGRSVRSLPEGPARSELEELSQVARDEVGRLDLILSKFLNALRGGAPEFAPCDVAEVLEKTLRVMRADVEEHDIRVELSHPASLPAVRADAEQLQQVFFNLVKNAVQAMGRGGVLSIDVSADDRDLAVSFRDSGAGIPEEQFRRLFEPFRTTKPDGHGIGLSIVRRVVEDHGGRVDVASKPGEGTCFRLVFPLANRKARMIGPARPEGAGREA